MYIHIGGIHGADKHVDDLPRQERQAFDADTERSLQQTPEIFQHCSLPLKVLRYACNLASPWL